MKLIEVARQQKDLLNEGIAYIAVWQEAQKNGKRSWFTEDIFPADMDKEEPVFDEEQKVRLAEIAALDADAVLLNGYYHAWIGSVDEPLNAASIAKGIENHYLMHNALISGYLADEPEAPLTDEDSQPDFESLKLTEREELGLGRERHENYQSENGMQASDVPEKYDGLTIEYPMDGFTPEKLDNLFKMVNAKAALLKAALATDELPIQQTADTLRFPWFWEERILTGDEVTAYSTLVSLLCKTAKEKKRVTAKEKAVEGSSKYAMRCFLLSLGMIGTEYKVSRRILLSRLEGNSSWKNGKATEAVASDDSE